MCAINGIIHFNKNQNNVDPELLGAMRDAMSHRGPDGFGGWISPEKRIGFGHRRLSILDLSEKASQPMQSDNGVVVVFNGEIYNYVELKKEINAQARVNWKTNHSDTEVLLEAYNLWGLDFVHKLRGMFALGLWDPRVKKLFLVRDRLGKKPIYFYKNSEKLYFASEIKALLTDKTISRKLNKEAFFHYLSFLTSPAPTTLFQDIFKIPPATIVTVDSDGNMKSEKYWDPINSKDYASITSEPEAKEQILSTLKDSIKLRKASDVPVGVFLSGGIDSSTNAVLFSEDEKQPINTFTIGYEGNNQSYANENEFAKDIAKRIGANYHEKLLKSDDLLSFMDRMIYLQDEPIADPVTFPLYYLAKLARDNNTIVCQIGEGADELFFGYPGLQKIRSLEQKMNVMSHLGLVQAGRLWGHSFGQYELFRYEYFDRASRGQPLFWGGAESFTHCHKMKLMHSSLREQFKERSSWEVIEPHYKNFLNKTGEYNAINWMSYLDLNLRIPELLLMRVDKMTMGASVEARAPFLDHELVELCFRIHPDLKYKNDSLKYILKESVRNILPSSILDRKKQGFGVPLNDWLLSGLGEEFRNKLNNFCRRTELLDAEEVGKLLAGNRQSTLWYLYNFILWWEKFIE